MIEYAGVLNRPHLNIEPADAVMVMELLHGVALERYQHRGNGGIA